MNCRIINIEMRESDRIKIEMSEDTSDNDQRDVGYLRKLERACELPIHVKTMDGFYAPFYKKI